jgi:hypothetical protein
MPISLCLCHNTIGAAELNDSSTLKNRKTSNEDEQKNTLYRVWLP